MSYRREDKQAAHLRFDDLTPGYRAELSHTVTQADVDAFAELTGDFNPIHIDPEFARATSFGKPIVHGMLTSSFISTMIGMLLPGRGALWMAQTLNFNRPTFVGDTITVRSEVKQASLATRTIICGIEVVNQNGAAVVSGEATVRLLDDGDPASQQAEAPTRRKSPSIRDAVDAAGSVVLITGGSRGIGAAAARRLAAEGHAVAINYHRSADAAEALAAEIGADGGRAVAVAADVADGAAVDAMFDIVEAALGPITGVVHCAAPEPVPQPFANVAWETFEAQFRTQIGGAYHCARRALPAMIDGTGGAMVFLGSIYGDSAPPPQQAAYVAAKAGLAGLTRSLAVEYGPQGVRANLVAPGMTNTAMIANLPDKAKMLAKMNTPLRRLAEPDDIARVIAFLIGEGGRHITGETIHVSGGVTMG